MISNFLLIILNGIYYGLIDFFIIDELPLITKSTFQSAVNFFVIDLKPIYGFINLFFPLQIFFTCVIAIIALIGSIMIFHGVRFVVSIFKPGIK